MRIDDFTKKISLFKNKKILVIGDLMIDKFLIGDTERISPEAPIPVVLVQREECLLGGAANVASNLKSMQVEVELIGIIGRDACGEKMCELLHQNNIGTANLVIDDGKPTIEKLRVISRGQQIVRIDKESTNKMSKAIEGQLLKKIQQVINSCDAVILSDYAKGVFTKKLVKKIIESAKDSGKIVVGDIKPQNKLFFKNISYITPNFAEAKFISGSNDKVKAGQKIQKMLNCNLLITDGACGLTIFDDKKILDVATHAVEIYDVVGAGDTVTATFTAALCSGFSPFEAGYLANLAAGIAVSKFGTATVGLQELVSCYFSVQENDAEARKGNLAIDMTKNEKIKITKQG